MSEGALQQVKDMLNQIITTRETMFPVDVKISPSNHIRVFLDADDGITIEKCTAINRALYKRIEESGLFSTDNFSLEVSSPGVDEPLKLHRQYQKNIGRKIEVILPDGATITGILTAVMEHELIVEKKTGKGNKINIEPITISFNQVKQAKVLTTF